jgi:hypothetical protein
MKHNLITYSLAALSLLTGASAYAQASNQANVPFAFTAGNVTLPAGDYLIQQKSESNFITIADVKSGKVVFAFSSAAESLPLDATAKLVFHRYGTQHFLAAIWTGAGGTARTFTPTDVEKQSRAHLVAANSTDAGNQETVAMK